MPPPPWEVDRGSGATLALELQHKLASDTLVPGVPVATARLTQLRGIHHQVKGCSLWPDLMCASSKSCRGDPPASPWRLPGAAVAWTAVFLLSATTRDDWQAGASPSPRLRARCRQVTASALLPRVFSRATSWTQMQQEAKASRRNFVVGSWESPGRVLGRFLGEYKEAPGRLLASGPWGVPGRLLRN